MYFMKVNLQRFKCLMQFHRFASRSYSDKNPEIHLFGRWNLAESTCRKRRSWIIANASAIHISIKRWSTGGFSQMHRKFSRNPTIRLLYKKRPIRMQKTGTKTENRFSVFGFRPTIRNGLRRIFANAPKIRKSDNPPAL